MIALTLGNSLRAVISPQRLHGCIESISGNGSTGIVSLTTEVFCCASYALLILKGGKNRVGFLNGDRLSVGGSSDTCGALSA
jgi:hypothetical protein